MKALENRTTDSKREMDILDALQDIRARNARNERVGNSDDLLARMEMEEIETEEDREKKRLEEEDEKLVRAVFSKIPASESGDASEPVITVKRKADDVEPTLDSLLPDSAKALISAKANLIKRPKINPKSKLGIKIVKKKPVAKV